MATAIPSSHTAIGIAESQGPLTTFVLPTPRPGKGQLLVKTEYLGVSPLSQWQVDFGLLVTQWPLVLAGNLVGRVVALRDDVREELQLGDTVGLFANIRSQTEFRADRHASDT
jgi:D-arabinose 1-dehydrogenase-like Zn-dependent alcohol dehydrogenase